MNCPHCNTNKYVVKAGLRSVRQGTIQKYYCKTCGKYFTDKTQPYTQYPLRVILFTLQSYNRGYSVKKAKTLTGKKYRYSPPTRTIYSWIKRYQDILTFIRLRKKYNLDPNNLTTTHRFQHKQIYPFTYHHLKLNLHSKQIPQLRRYIRWIERSLNRDMFLKGPRCSSTETIHDSKVEKKDNVASELTRLALNSTSKNTCKSPHELVEHFFLINDSTTVCTELPVFIRENEIDLDTDEPITGHIDLIQIRYKNLYILDYKPNLNRPERHASQLQLYKKAIYERTSIPEDKIHTAVFNRHGYYEF